MNKKHSQEFAFIKKFLKSRKKNQLPKGVIGIGDDTALIPSQFFGKKNLLITTDSLTEGHHFRTDWCNGKDIAVKLVEMNASDILTKGGIPEFALLNMQIPRNDFQSKFINQFQKKIRDHLLKRKIHLIGGDTTSGNALTFTLTMLGRTKVFIPRKSKIPIKKGDKLFLAGDPGISEFGLRFLKQKDSLNSLQSEDIKNNSKIKKYCRPKAFWKWKKIFHHKAIKASIDQSDSFHETLTILSDENQAHFHLDLSFIRTIQNLSDLKTDERISVVLNGGEDFCILFIIDPQKMNSSFLRHIDKYQYKEIGYVKSIHKSGISYYLDDTWINPKNYLNPYLHFPPSSKELDGE